jgi:hypothetical protein
MLSGNGTLRFIVLWPLLNGHSASGFLVVAAATAGYLCWQARILANARTGLSSQAVV